MATALVFYMLLEKAATPAPVLWGSFPAWPGFAAAACGRKYQMEDIQRVATARSSGRRVGRLGTQLMGFAPTVRTAELPA
jgi:hypothetical protein